MNPAEYGLSGEDLDFVVNEVAPEFHDREKLKQLILEDGDFRKHFLGSDKVFWKVIAEGGAFIRISPTFYFEVLLRRALKEMDATGHTYERVGLRKIPVFDNERVVRFLSNECVLLYLADLLSSFTRVGNFTLTVREGKGIWRKIRFSDMDIDSLIRLSRMAGREYRAVFYKRIADVCLFLMGVFPEYVQFGGSEPPGRDPDVRIPVSWRKPPEEYEEKGRTYYRLASESETGIPGAVKEAFRFLAGDFTSARKPLEFVSQRYLDFRKRELFGF